MASSFLKAGIFKCKSFRCRVTIIYNKKEGIFGPSQEIISVQQIQIGCLSLPPYLFHPWISAVKEQTQQCNPWQIRANRFLFSILLFFLLTLARVAIVLQTQKLQNSQNFTSQQSLSRWVTVNLAMLENSRHIPARFVMALDNAKAEETPFPPPDISSPNSNFANLSLICSISEL